MRFRAKNTWDSAQGHIQCMKRIGDHVVRTDERTYSYGHVQLRDGHVTITSLPKFLGLMATSCPGPSPRSKWRSEKPLAKAAKMAPKIR